MDLLSKLLLLPITGPVRGLWYIAEQVKEQVDAELDPGRRAQQVQAELMDLSVRRDLGQISDAEYAAQETALLEQLNELLAEQEALREAIPVVEQEALREAIPVVEQEALREAAHDQ